MNFTPRQSRTLDILCGDYASALEFEAWDYVEALLDELFRLIGLDPPVESTEREDRGHRDA